MLLLFTLSPLASCDNVIPASPSTNAAAAASVATAPVCDPSGVVDRPCKFLHSAPRLTYVRPYNRACMWGFKKGMSVPLVGYRSLPTP